MIFSKDLRKQGYILAGGLNTEILVRLNGEIEPSLWDDVYYSLYSL